MHRMDHMQWGEYLRLGNYLRRPHMSGDEYLRWGIDMQRSNDMQWNRWDMCWYRHM